MFKKKKKDKDEKEEKKKPEKKPEKKDQTLDRAFRDQARIEFLTQTKFTDPTQKDLYFGDFEQLVDGWRPSKNPYLGRGQ